MSLIDGHFNAYEHPLVMRFNLGLEILVFDRGALDTEEHRNLLGFNLGLEILVFDRR